MNILTPHFLFPLVTEFLSLYSSLNPTMQDSLSFVFLKVALQRKIVVVPWPAHAGFLLLLTSILLKLTLPILRNKHRELAAECGGVQVRHAVTKYAHGPGGRIHT